MTLLQLTEPLFQYICRLNRIGRRAARPGGGGGDTTSFVKSSLQAAASAAPVVPTRGAAMDYTVVRSEIKALLEDMMAKAAGDMRLSVPARKIELPLIFFVDSMISESKLPFAGEWNQNRMAYDRQELAGDEKFFDLLDETAKENGEDVPERLAVFYTCIGLGFAGVYFSQPEFLRKTMLSIAPRIRHLVEIDPNARICPESYEAIDTRNLVEPAGNRMVLMGLVFGVLMLAVLVSYFVMYYQASKELNHSIGEVLTQDAAVESAK